ncbi:MAG TPA: putative 2OG-Fe(II) oxygenase [Gammaproteobacteria bacterium]|nr:hypothetical protein [Xanthomonadales bacterium]HOP22649.1 putative 2OG-Fe(II) oxygenase [Gammaproteobacteria bacterium]HPI96567.1 putative 2OG-Fe(II) oxygenase [Gammaproteobacteria bacterium]HPQ87951.1 putative 2OG-Fe(II) oxygenase [Gammaproteobacteria bacterium]
MNSKILTAFFTPIGTSNVTLEESESDNLIKKIYQLEKEGWENKITSQPIEYGVFESPHQLFQLDDSIIKSISNRIIKEVVELVCELNKYSQEDAKKLDCYAASWFHIMRKSGFVQPHNHPNASWSAVYCVDSGDDDVTKNSSLIFPSPSVIPMYVDAGNANIDLPLANDVIRFNLKKGDLIIFQSHLFHYVSSHLSDKPRITIAANFWFNLR